MKQKYFLMMMLFTLILPAPGHPQTKATIIDSLTIELWPDYDRASVLVLLTGALPIGTTLPATVTVPIPEAAQLNAVARIDSRDDQMKDDISFNPVPGGLSFTTPDLRFRLEYYLPYAVNNDQHTFEFNWLAAISVNQFQLKIQRPLSASQLTTKPLPLSVFSGEDGFTYYVFPKQALPAGQSFSVQVNYTMTTAQLSVERLALPRSRLQEPGLSATGKTGSDVNWPLIGVAAAGLIIIIILVWQMVTRRPKSVRPAAKKKSPKKESYSKFCSNCDSPVDKNDKFCRNCGAAL